MRVRGLVKLNYTQIENHITTYIPLKHSTLDICVLGKL